MINGQWFMAHGPRMVGGLAGAPMPGGAQQSVSHEPLTINNNPLINASFDCISVVLLGITPQHHEATVGVSYEAST